MHLKNLIRLEWQLLLFGFSMTFFSLPGQTVFIALFSGQIRSELNLSHSQFSSIYSLATLCSAGLLVWTGGLTDRVPLRRLAATVVLILALACVGMSLVTSSILLFISIFVLRQSGQGLMTLCGVTAVVRYLPASRGRSTAIGAMGYTLAEAIMPVSVVALMLWLGWRNTWLVVALVLICITIPLILYLLKSQRQRHAQYQESIAVEEADKKNQQQRKHWRRSEVLRHPGFYLVLPAIMAHPFLFTGLAFHQIQLLETKGWLLTQWTSLFFIYSPAALIASLLSGILIDRFRAQYLLYVSPLCLAFGLLVITQASSISHAAIALFCIGIGSGANATSVAPFWVEAYGSKHLGAIKSLATSLVVFFSALSPVATGLLLDAGLGIETLTLYGAVYGLLTLILLFFSSCFFCKPS